MLKYTYHKDGYKPDNEIFVFGSNLAGIHGAGAAKEAYRNYGAEWGAGVGLHGQSYAIPTKDDNIKTMSLSAIKPYIDYFLKVAAIRYSDKFYVSRVGCGLAGYKDSDIAPMFKGATNNVSFAEEWRPYLEEDTDIEYNNPLEALLSTSHELGGYD